jgi:hypothetical protein
MSQFLEKDTAPTVVIGPFVDDTDGVSLKTGLSILATDVKISKAGAAFGNRSDGTAPVHMVSGIYNCLLNATDTASAGTLDLACKVAGAMVVAHRFNVVDTATTLATDVTKWNGTAVPAEDTAGYPICTVKTGSGTGELDLTSGVVQAEAGIQMRKNVALSNFAFVMLDSADNVTPKAGLTVTAQRSLDGAAFAACANAVTELSNGIYKINLDDTDTNGLVVVLRFTATGAADRTITVLTTLN